jgi:cytochrome c-type biogenesis protein CcmH
MRMAIWVLLATMTGGAVLAVLWPLTRRPRPVAVSDDDTTFYRAQIAEIERDRDRGLIAAPEAEAAKVEAGRRLLRAAERQKRSGDLECEPALRRRRAATAVALSIAPLVALSIYGALGSPSLPAQPLSARLKTEPAKLEFAEALTRIEGHLAQNPQDWKGWEVIAPVYLRMGRAADAARAFEAVIRLNGETAQRLAAFGEASVAASSGVVEAKARDAFDRALKLDGTLSSARFYLALAAEQDGDKDGALTRYQELHRSLPPNTPQRALVESRITRLGGAVTASLADLPEDQKTAINAMVEGLAARLKSDASDAEGWLRLVRSYVVLGERDKASEALATARTSLSARPEELERLATLAKDLKLDEAGAGK